MVSSGPDVQSGFTFEYTPMRVFSGLRFRSTVGVSDRRYAKAGTIAPGYGGCCFN
jgi:hypothetical protein